MPSPGSVRRRVGFGFFVVLRLTGAFDDERPLVVRCSDVRETGRFARAGREEPERPAAVLRGASDGGADAARRGEAAAGRVGVSQYGQMLQRGSTGFPHDSHGSLIRARQLGQRR